jgi:hypothetical protein
MYPFERFTERAKKVLTLAQQEAERSHHSYIGTEHLLLGLLREKDGMAAITLASLGIEIQAVRKTIESVLGRNEGIIIQQIIPTSRVMKVIELSFAEARRMGQNFVGTEHLLLGLMIEGEGIACHVLEDLGATLAKVRAEIGRLLLQGELGKQPPEPGPGTPRRVAPPLGRAAVLAIRLAGHLAEVEAAPEVTAEHIRQTLSHSGTQPLFELNARIDTVDGARRKAIESGDHDDATADQELLRKLREDFTKAEQAWVKSLRSPGG